MKQIALFLWFCGGISFAAALQLHPDNPHYFLFREKPAVLITSAEHYGSQQ